MQTSLRVLRTLSLSIWVGSIVFFAFGVAPVAFHVLPTTHQAGLVVGNSLRVLHGLALGCGIICLAAIGWEAFGTAVPKMRRSNFASMLLVMAMLALTAFSQFSILPNMESDRVVVGGDIDRLPLAAPTRADFDRRHHLSERVEGAVLLCGLLALTLTAAQRVERAAAPLVQVALSKEQIT